jgi:hypothetical protein
MGDSSVTVWRGLALHRGDAAGDIMARIRSEGCPLERGFQICVPLVPHHEESPVRAAEIVRERGPEAPRYDEESPSFLATCVCGDPGGALHYALRETGRGLLVEARVEESRLTVDGRDGLYSLLPGLCRSSPDVAHPVLPVLKRSFGDVIESYIEAGRALSEEDVQLYFRFVDHAVMDRRVIHAHLASRVLILGRYGTRFCSAFGVIGGIRPTDIVDVREVDRSMPLEENYSDELDVYGVRNRCRG